jgi:hypothetical protein
MRSAGGRDIKELRDKIDWCAWQDSNLRPPAPEAGALSTELQALAEIVA